MARLDAVRRGFHLPKFSQPARFPRPLAALTGEAIETVSESLKSEHRLVKAQTACPIEIPNIRANVAGQACTRFHRFVAQHCLTPGIQTQAPPAQAPSAPGEQTNRWASSPAASQAAFVAPCLAAFTMHRYK